ncbi:fibrobacter succinogenes major paralogous domain-containing protein [Brumimicrobium oceani]|uniref:Fibrobacter succinogenes major paralogous domain-containing protein n=1 Tax=Brumimicrobium oceani TaxID=2100725 RepID=A0A2U2X352_9FLAO|nr:FISUMP domain-containing protein [Brumimicrobium oceani]PWH82200.1 hypothetical protein DIT68_13920 [Brumimicrobium oceani]
MRKTILTTFTIMAFAFCSDAQNIGINTIGATPDNSAILDLNSTDKGFLISRADTFNINSPAFGLMTLAPIDSCLYMFSGNNWVSIGGVGANCPSPSIPTVTPPSTNCVPETFIYKGVSVTYGAVLSNAAQPRCWLDRNLGADQIATSKNDQLAYGDLFQWGRLDDLHQNRNSAITVFFSATDIPGHGDFIREYTNQNNGDWRQPKNDNLWQGVAGINNPCPADYRLPTDIELEAERISWSTNDATGAFNSPLKLALAGQRLQKTGVVVGEGEYGVYWSSTIHSNNPPNLYSPIRSKALSFHDDSAGMGSSRRASGFSIRCIKN